MSGHELKFKAEIRQLLDLMIHSIYSNKDIFIRELVANAADALDKQRFLAVTDTSLARDWEIRIEADEAAGTLTIRDNGVGMTEEELQKNLGTIAHSGTKTFLANLAKKKENPALPEMIGQFGVGFYSAFMAADSVEVITRKFDAPSAFKWVSDGKEGYSIEEVPSETFGSAVILHLKDDFKQYLDSWKIASVIRKYSDYIEYPIRMKQKVGSGKDEKIEDATLNTMKAIWLRKESEVSEEEYNSFYAHLTQEYGDPLRRINFAAEGAAEFKSILFFSSHLPFNFQFGMKNQKKIHLYVKRVFITDDCPGILPDYMGFVSGVVDSSDLPLNISRETLQDNPQIARISKVLTKRIFAELSKMLDSERAKYEEFYKEFSRMLKEGVHSDYANREKLQDLLLFESLHSEKGKVISLKEYVQTMPERQKEIYFISGASREQLEASPRLELFRKQNFDVLLLTDPVDEFVIGEIGRYAEKPIVSAAKGDLKLDEEAQKELDKQVKDAEESGKDFIGFLKKALENKVKEVRFSARLTESACCLVSDSNDPTDTMQRILRAMDKNTPEFKRILELNPENPLIQALQSLYTKTPDSPELNEYAELLFDQAVLGEGGELADPVLFAKRTATLMTRAIQEKLS